MTEPAERPNRLISLTAPIALGALIFYFAFAAIQGEYGTFRRIQVEAQAIKLERELDALRGERAVLENRTRRLSTEFLDLDLLDEQARKVLGYARADEIIIR